jgi:hypothetical protein
MKDGAPGGIRTPDPLLRRQTLFPTELRAHWIDTKIFVLRAHVVLVNHSLLRRRTLVPTAPSICWLSRVETSTVEVSH